MLINVANLSDGKVSVNDLRISLDVGENKDIEVTGKVALALNCGSDECESLLQRKIIAIRLYPALNSLYFRKKAIEADWDLVQ